MDPLAYHETVEFIAAQQLIDHSFTEEFAEFAKRFQTVDQLTSEMVRIGKLTPYQQALLVAGEGRRLIFGPYRLVEPLGEGGMGKVFKARHPRLDRLVALKFIHPECRESRSHVISRFHREARAIAQLHHPNVVILYDADEIDGTPYIAMEFVDGVSLADMVRRNGPLGINQACEYMRQAALGLQHAYECGLVHRDIKPSNIVASQKKGASQASWKGLSLVSVRDRNRMQDGSSGGRADIIKILDMGLALLRDSLKGDRRGDETALTATGAMLGTPDYISPEQARDARNVDIRADLYSLGCTFYYILSGRLPFPEGTAIEKVLKHQLDRPASLELLRPSVPSAVVSIVEKLMAKKPDDRFQTPQELVDALARQIAQSDPDLKPSSEFGMSTRSTIPSMASNPSRVTARLKTVDKFTDPKPSVAMQVSDDLRPLCAPAFTNTELPLNSAPVFSDTVLPFNVLEHDNNAITEKDAAPETIGNIITNLTKSSERDPFSKMAAHTGVVSGVAVSPTGRLAATGDVNGRIRIWDLGKSPPREIATAHRPTEIQAIAFAPDESNYIVFGELHLGKAALVHWDWSSQSFQEWGDFTTLDHSGVGCLRFSADGAILSAGIGALAVTWKVENGVATGRKIHKGQATPIRALALSPDHLMLATAGQQDALRFWDLGKRSWNRTDGFQARSHAASITTMCFSPDGKTLAMAGLDPEIALWNMAGSEDQSVRVLRGHSNNVLHIQFIGDGSQLVSVGVDGQVLFWGLRTGTTSREFSYNLNMAYRVAMSDDATRLVVGFSNGTVAFCNYPPATSVASGCAKPLSHAVCH